MPGELAPHAIDRVLNTVRDGTDTLGTVSERSRELRWEGTWPGHRLDVAIVPRDGSTTLRLTQHTGGAALGRTAIALASVAGVGAPSVWLLLTVVLNVPAPSWGVPLTSAAIASVAAAGGIVTALAALPLGRWLVRRMHRFHEARLRTLADLLAVRVEEGARHD